MLPRYLLIFLSSSVPFLWSLKGDFVFDDTAAILNNKDIQSDSWTDAFFNDFWGTNIKSNQSHKSYRPLTILSFKINYVSSGKNLNGLHFKIINLLCHVICCVLVLTVYDIIIKRLQCNKKNNSIIDLSLCAALLFCVHPIHVEAVSGIVGRADILSAIFFLLSFMSYDKSWDKKKYAYLYFFTSVILAGIAMLFKEIGITVLGFCIVYDLVPKLDYSNEKNSATELKLFSNINVRTLLRMLFTSLAAILLIYIRWLIMGEMKPEFHAINNPAAYASDIFTKVVTFNYIYFLNFLLLLWPQWLCYDWSMGCVPLIETIYDYRILFVLLIDLYAVLHIKALLHQSSKITYRRLTILAISLLTIPFLPASNILYPVGFVIAERILYLPSAGYCLLVAIGLQKLCGNVKTKTNKVFAAFVLLIFVYSLKTWQRAYDWQTEYNLFLSGLSVCPLNAKVHYNVAKVVDARHNTTWALNEYREAIRLHPAYYQAMNNLGNLLKHQKQYTEAEFYFRKSIEIKKDFPATWMNLGIVLSSTKRYKESEYAYKTALLYRRNYPDCFYNLGNLYLAINNTKEAAENWLAAIRLNPKHTYAWTNLLAMYDNTGQTEKALEIIPKALTELPDTPSLIFATANVYGRINKFTEAEACFKKAIYLMGQEVQAIHYSNFGVLYHRWNKFDKAKEMYKRALDIDPLFKSAEKNLALLRNQ